MNLNLYIDDVRCLADLPESNWLVKLLTRSTRKDSQMALTLSDIQVAVARNTNVIGSALTLIAGLRQQIIDAANDPVALQAIVDGLDQQDTALAAAVAAGTPAASQPAAPATPIPNA